MYGWKLVPQIAFAATAIALLISGSALGTSQKTELAGGSGGKGFTYECPHMALTGIELRQDDVVNRVQLMCSKVTGDSDLDPTKLLDGAGTGDRTGHKKQIKCPENYGIYSLTVVEDGDRVLDVALNCKDVTEGTVAEVDTGWDVDHGGGGAPEGTEANFLTCDDGSYGIGLTGRVNGGIIALGLVCSDDILVASNNPPPKNDNADNADNGDDGGPLTTDDGNGQPDQTGPTPGPDGGAKWAAFAKGSGETWGYSVSRPSEDKASADALAGCGGDANGCKVFWTTQESCVAFAMSPAPDFYYAAGGGKNQDTAELNAIKFCQSGNAPPNSCQTMMGKCQ